MFAHTASLTVGTEAGCHVAQDGRGHVTVQPALALSDVFYITLSDVFYITLEFDVFYIMLEFDVFYITLSDVFYITLEFDVFIVSLLPPGEKPGFLCF